MRNSKLKLKKTNIPKISRFQSIEDFYLDLGYTGDDLRNALLKDREYQNLLKKRKAILGRRNKTSSSDKKKYVLSTSTDFEILAKCKRLENSPLNKEDMLLVKLIKSQLESEWRQPLLKLLNKFLQKYKIQE